MKQDIKDLFKIIAITLLIAFSIGIAAMLIAWIVEKLILVIGTVASACIVIFVIMAGVTAGSIIAFSNLVKEKKDV